MGLKKVLIALGVVFIIGTNFYLYRSEFKVKVDPNDNIFQYALVDEAKNIWKHIFGGKLSPFYLLDSWNERWADGFALSSYYAHLPQAVISLIGFVSPLGMYGTFVVVRTLMLIFLPLMFFWGSTILGLPGLAGLLVALFSQAIFTNGLYGIDLSSFVFRGWGLSAQLMALFFLPVAFAYGIDYLFHETNRSHRKLVAAVIFNFLVAQNHIGMFLLLLMAYPLWYVSQIAYGFLFENSIKDELRLLVPHVKRLALFLGLTLLSLSYFVVPFFTGGKYRNFSYWDPIWKFDSWGAKQIIMWLLNGELFDYQRFPIITLSVFGGVLIGIGALAGDGKQKRIFFFLSVLSVFFTVLFFGRTTLGGLVDLIPGFSEYHLHRIVVMVQFFGIFLAGWFIYSLLRWLERVFLRKKTGILAILLVLSVLFVYYLEKPLFAYMKDNAVWVERANMAYQADLPDYEKLTSKLAASSGVRIYAGKPGNWGKTLTVGEIPLYMALSRDGFPVIGFLPESWSPNSDQEQFFDENRKVLYDLYNVGFLILPAAEEPPDFAKLELSAGRYRLYSVKTDGWFTEGRNSISVESSKNHLLNVTRLWFMSPLMYRDFPSIDLTLRQLDGKTWKIRMDSLNSFTNRNDGKNRSIWSANPFTGFERKYQEAKMRKTDEKAMVNGYKTSILNEEECQNCIVVLKQSFHPNWKVTVNGQRAKTVPVFPFFIGIPIEKAGTYEIEAIYSPSSLKVSLVILSVLIFLGYFIFAGKRSDRIKI